MTDLVAFLTARLDDEQRAAEATHAAAWRVGNGLVIGDGGACFCVDSVETDREPARWMAETWHPGNAAHIARWDPARALSEVAAKRKLAEMHADAEPRSLTFHYCQTCGSGEPYEYPTEWPCDTIKLLTAPYADHPDYDPAWRPE